MIHEYTHSDRHAYSVFKYLISPVIDMYILSLRTLPPSTPSNLPCHKHAYSVSKYPLSPVNLFSPFSCQTFPHALPIHQTIMYNHTPAVYTRSGWKLAAECCFGHVTLFPYWTGRHHHSGPTPGATQIKTKRVRIPLKSFVHNVQC